MKRCLKIITSILLIMLFSVNTCFANANEQKENIKKVEETYNGVMSEWNGNYPEYYGGSYVNNDGNLVILLSENSAEGIQDIMYMSNTSDESDRNIVFEAAEYSYKNLQETRDIVDKYMLENVDSNSIGIMGCGIYDDKNKVIVEMKDISEEKINEFKNNVCDSPMIEFAQANGQVEHLVSTINPGCKIYRGAFAGSLGFPCRKGSSEGFVTAGHLVSNVGDKIKTGVVGSEIGTVTVFQDALNIDAAFVQTNGNFLVSDYTEYGNVKLGNYGWPAQNTTVVLEGSASKRPVEGIVLSTSYSTVVSGDYMTDLLKIDAQSLSGDSGGVVYNKNYSNIAGVITGGGDQTNITVVTKATNIFDAFGLERY